jgi:putative transcriptional regulator
MGVLTNLPALRETRGMTQGELAAAVGVSRQTINSVERGRFEPSLSLALVIARYFAMPLEDIFSLDR